MAGKEGYHEDFPPSEPPPSYCAVANQVYSISQYPSQQYGFPQQQSEGQSQPIGGQAQPYADQYHQYGQHASSYGVNFNTVVMGQPMVNYAGNAQTYQQDHMSLAIFATMCCWPLGILAIMRASEARTAFARGDMVSAKILSHHARNHSVRAIIAGLVMIAIVIITISVIVTT